MCDVVDLNYLKTLFTNDKDLLEIINVYKIELHNCAEGLKNALEAEDYQIIEEISHKMKSSVGYIGLSSLEEKLKLINKQSRGSDEGTKELRKLIQTTIEECRILEKEMSLIEKELSSS